MASFIADCSKIETDGACGAINADDIRERLNAVLGNDSNQEIAKKTGCNSETVRRYRITGRTKALFIAAVAVNYDVNADWLLTGRGSRCVTTPDRESIAKVLRSIASTIELNGH